MIINFSTCAPCSSLLLARQFPFTCCEEFLIYHCASLSSFNPVFVFTSCMEENHIHRLDCLVLHVEQNNFSIHKFPRRSPVPTGGDELFQWRGKVSTRWLAGEKDKACVLQIFGHESRARSGKGLSNEVNESGINLWFIISHRTRFLPPDRGAVGVEDWAFNRRKKQKKHHVCGNRNLSPALDDDGYEEQSESRA